MTEWRELKTLQDVAAAQAAVKRKSSPRKPLIDRFFDKVQKTDGCWIWTGSTGGKNGYGYIHAGIANSNRRYRAHYASYVMFVGDVPEGLFVCHKCDNPKCVNPSHLFVGNNSDNMKDMVAKGRHCKSRKRPTVCVRGHSLADENVRIDKNGHRWCKTCAKIRDAKRGRPGAIKICSENGWLDTPERVVEVEE